MTGADKRIAPLSISQVFLESASSPDEDHVPLTPFMVHVWRLHGLNDDHRLQSLEERRKFLYWFYDAYQKSKAPYRWPIPAEILRYLNQPASLTTVDLPGQSGYLSRFMQHIWKQHRHELDIQRREGYLRFLTWFALDYIPDRNLTPSLISEDLIAALNYPVCGEGIPLTTAMVVDGQTRSPGLYENIANQREETLLAMAFELLADILRAGDPRLVPDFVSRFWFRKMSAEPESLNAYEHMAASACLGRESPLSTVRHWLANRFRAVLPQADPFITASSEDTRIGALEDSGLRIPEKTAFVYRDHVTISGLSTAGRYTHDALNEAGLPVIDLDFSFAHDRMMQEYLYNARQRGRGRSSLHLLHLNPEYVPECLMSHLVRLSERDYIIGHFAWELSDISSVHECALSMVNEIWVPSNYVRDIYRPRVDVPICVMGHAVEPAPATIECTRATFGLPEDCYVFLVAFDAGSIVERKNPVAAVQAFRKAFPVGSEKCLLVIKARNIHACQTERDRAHWRKTVELAAADPRIHLIEKTMSAGELSALYLACDCFLSPHRSEGFGFGPAEAMRFGKPVIATGYSGVTEFCTPDTAILIKYSLVSVPPGSFPFMNEGGEYRWAAPDIDDAALHMRELYESPDIGRQLGEAGRRVITNQFSRAALRRRFVQRLSELGWV
jgi:glycosyltransferase involved in cell wall biosynthesis